MIRIRISSGPHAGKMRDVVDGKFVGVEVNPVGLLTQLFELGSRWEIDFAGATVAEALEWGRADLVIRIVRALFEGRSVTFMNQVFQAPSPELALETTQRIEDVISTSGYHVVVERDDAEGVVIGTRQQEHRTQ